MATNNKIENPKIDALLKEGGENRAALYFTLKDIDELLVLVKESFPKNAKYGKGYQYAEQIKAYAELYRTALQYRSEISKCIKSEIDIIIKIDSGGEDVDKVENLKKFSKELLRQAMDLKIPIDIGKNYYDEDKEINDAHKSKKGIFS